MPDKDRGPVLNAPVLKAQIGFALDQGYTIESIADEFADILNYAQREYEKKQMVKERDAATKTLQQALSDFAKAYIGEDMPLIDIDLLKGLGLSLRDQWDEATSAAAKPAGDECWDTLVNTFARS